MSGPDKTLAIIGLARNTAPHLPGAFAMMERLAATVRLERVIIVTNDNEDGTDAVLDQARHGPLPLTIINMDGLASEHEQRVDRLAVARQASLEALFASPSVPDFTLILDMDGLNNTLDPVVVKRLMDDAHGDWQAVFANQPNAYFDIYALRRRNWCDYNFMPKLNHEWKQVAGRPRFKKLLSRLNPFDRTPRSRQELKIRYVHRLQYRIPADYPWIEVDSAFGGAGLYRTASLRGKTYRSRGSQGMVICEHVSLHAQMRAEGARLFIVPWFLNENHEHLDAASGRTFPRELLT